MFLVDFFSKYKTTCFFSNLFLISGNGKLFVISSWPKKKRVKLVPTFSSPFSFPLMQKTVMVAIWVGEICVLRFADLKSLRWKVLRKRGWCWIGEYSLYCLCNPLWCIQIWKQLLYICFFFQHENPFWIIFLWYFLCCLYHIWRSFCSFDWLSFIFLFRVKELVFSSWPQTTEFNIQRSCSAYTFLFICFFWFLFLGTEAA